ncbi:MAG TPA: hypothetical protein VLF90_00785 [Patescibacteria group bacterium]|nr:hypothetical protein [Patescibacteria group bacterium]
MNGKRVFYGMIVITSLLGIGIFVTAILGDQMLQQRSQKLVDLKLNNAVLDQQQVSLAKAKKDVAKYSELEKEAKIIVPQDKDQAEAVREIVNFANNNSIKLSAITFPASTLGSSSSGLPTTTPSNKLTQVLPVKGIPGVLDMQITIQQDASNPISYTQLINFLNNLEQNRRTAQVANVTIIPNPQNPNTLTFTLVLDAYIKP